MNLLRADLEEHGTRAVSFNAWHHQKEHHLFAALLQAVRDQAIPALSSVRFRDILFRWNLLKSHFKDHPILGATTVFLSGIWAWSFGTENLQFCSTLGLFVDLCFFAPSCVVRGPPIDANNVNVLHLILNLSPIPLIAFLCLGVIPKLARWKVDPGRLLANASRGLVRIRNFKDQLGLRHRFEEAFKEVSEALRPQTLLILVDDLDRCRAGASGRGP